MHSALFGSENVLESLGLKGATLMYYYLLKGYTQERIDSIASAHCSSRRRLLDPAQCL